MKRISTEFKIGVVVIIGIAVLFMGVNYLKGFKVFEDQNDYLAFYENINGLSESNPVTLNGYKVGQIRRIELVGDGSGRIKVVMTVFEKKLKIPEDSEAEIYSSDLLGSKAVRLHLGDSDRYLSPNDTLGSSTEATLAESVNRQVQPVKNKAENLISSIDSLVGIVQTILNQDARSKITSSVNSLDRTMASLDRAAQRMDNLVKDEKAKIASITSNLNSFLATLEGKKEGLSRTFDNLENISDSLADADLKATIGNVERTMNDLSAIAARIQKGEGSLGKLTQSDSLHQELMAASKDLDLLLKDMRYHPDRYVHFSVFGKKREGVKLSEEEMEALQKFLEKQEKEKEEEENE